MGMTPRIVVSFLSSFSLGSAFLEHRALFDCTNGQMSSNCDRYATFSLILMNAIHWNSASWTSEQMPRLLVTSDWNMKRVADVLPDVCFFSSGASANDSAAGSICVHGFSLHRDSVRKEVEIYFSMRKWQRPALFEQQ